jgi:hypothetical protein
MLPTVSQHQAIGFTFIFQTQRSNGNSSGTDPGFQVRGGGVLKKFARAEGGAKIVGVFRVKNHDFTPKNDIFSNCGGRREHFCGI